MYDCTGCSIWIGDIKRYSVFVFGPGHFYGGYLIYICVHFDIWNKKNFKGSPLTI